MPSLLDLRRRIRAVKNTQQITKAMKMIAASRLRRAQDRVIAARPYAQQTLRVLNSLASRVESNRHPLLAHRPESSGPALLFVLTADKGLCGGFNTNILKQAGTFIVDSPARQVALGLVGRKGRDFFKRRGFDVRYEAVNVFSHLKFSDAQAIAATAIDEFCAQRVGSVHLIYNEFKSVVQQRVVIERLLPLPRLATTDSAVPPVEYVFEPEPERILDTLLPRHVEIQIYRALLESAAAEHAARMTAMDSATKNAADVIEQLTLYMNKVRQASITREIIEVVSGAEAL
ncbi:MAG: ATP synthase F1 subunit gamma [Vicinamibacterales bacterium]